MMSATLALADLETKLGTLATTRVGRAALETTSATLPVITLVSLRDTLAAEQLYDATAIYTRQAVIEYKCAATSTYHETLNTALTAIRALLGADAGDAWLGGNALGLRETGATFYHPAGNGADAAIQVAIEFDYIED